MVWETTEIASSIIRSLNKCSETKKKDTRHPYGHFVWSIFERNFRRLGFEVLPNIWKRKQSRRNRPLQSVCSFLSHFCPRNDWGGFRQHTTHFGDFYMATAFAELRIFSKATLEHAFTLRCVLVLCFCWTSACSIQNTLLNSCVDIFYALKSTNFQIERDLKSLIVEWMFFGELYPKMSSFIVFQFIMASAFTHIDFKFKLQSYRINRIIG